MSAILRTEDLEKENFNLNNELDKLEIPPRVTQIISHRAGSTERSKTPDPTERILKRMEDRNRQLSKQVAEAETKFKRERDNLSLNVIQLENEVMKLRTDNENLLS